MRWSEPSEGDKKIVTKFLLFPLTINFETRWLEKATIRYKYFNYIHGGGWWQSVEFLDDMEETL